MRELLGKLMRLALMSPYFLGQLALSVMLSIGCAAFVIDFAGKSTGALVELFAHGGLFDTVMFLALVALIALIGVLLALITRSAIRWTLESAREIVADVGQVATISRELIVRRAAPEVPTRGGLSLSVDAGAEGGLSQVASGSSDLELVDEAVALGSFEPEEEVARAREQQVSP